MAVWNYASEDLGGDWSEAGLEPLVRLVTSAADRNMFQPDPLIPMQVAPCRETFCRVKAVLVARACD